MAKYAVGDHVSWNSEAGRFSGTISKVHEVSSTRVIRGVPRRTSLKTRSKATRPIMWQPTRKMR